MAESVESLLTEWGLSNLIEFFNSNGIDKDVFNDLNPKDIEELIPVLGPRKKFVKNFEFYLKAREASTAAIDPTPVSDIVSPALIQIPDLSTLPIGVPVNVITPSDGGECILEIQDKRKAPEESGPSNEPAPKRSNNIKVLPTILKSTINGLIIWNFHEVKKQHWLAPKYKDLLTDVIVSHYIAQSPSYVIEFRIFDEISNEIVELFSEEQKEVYFIPPHKKCLAKGKLPNKYHNLRKELKISGVIKSKNADSDACESYAASEDEAALLDWLKSNWNSAWHTIEAKWSATSKARLNSLQSPPEKGKETALLLDYFKQYPCLQNRLGYTLLEKDFDYLYPGKDRKLLDSWDAFSLKIWKIIESRKRSSPFEDLDEDTLNSTEALLRFSEIFTPALVRATKGTKCWKASRAEMQDGFLIHVKVIGDLASRIDRRKEKLASVGARLQPSAVVVGVDSDHIVSSYVQFDDVRYEVESPLRAVDVCFKIYLSLHAEYPPESAAMWMVIQKLVFDINTKWDKNSTTLQSIIAELRQI